MDLATTSRPYRSSKRSKPCDRCRTRKARCEVIAGSHCTRCERAGVDCSFSRAGRLRPRRRSRSEIERTPPSPTDHHAAGQNYVQWSDGAVGSRRAEHSSQSNDPARFNQPSSTPQQQDLMTQFSTQFSSSLEGMTENSAHLFGSSSESDPWLWRHCKFNDFGSRSLNNSEVRNAGGVPLAHKIPIHFNIESNEVHESAKQETMAFDRSIASRDELDQVVPPEHGLRLVALFHRHVFPLLPVVSRSQLGMYPSVRTPSMSALERCPVHLLAALYAISLRFTSDDEHLAVWSAQTAPPAQALWRLVYEELQEAIHQPQLSVLQAALLYLHKEPNDEKRYSLAETPFTWTWTGKLVGLAASLGLHIECSMWAMPSWEKRLRKRLWWAVYAEDKWRALLMGRPPYIHPQEWDVEPLTSSDFGPEQLNRPDHGPITFISFIRLTTIADAVQEAFYSLRASQKLSVDMDASVSASTPLLERLEDWRSCSVNSNDSVGDGQEGNRYSFLPPMHFAYHVLVVYVYRALLRPMVQSAIPPYIIDLEEPPSLQQHLGLGDFNWEDTSMANVTPFLATNAPAESQAELTKDVTRAANECAMGTINHVHRLSVADLSGFWYSWSRIGYATISNFVVLLVVQAPNSQYAEKAKQSLDIWSRILRIQSRICPMVRFGMLRLNSLTLAGLTQTFLMPPHVEQALNPGLSGGQGEAT